jgi:hypothetical protein
MSVKFGDFSGKVRYSKRMGPEFEKMKIFHDLQWNRIIVLKLMLGVPPNYLVLFGISVLELG